MPRTIIPKYCAACKTTKSLAGFSKNRVRKDGHASQCKGCVSAYRKVYNASEVGKSLQRQNTAKYKERYPDKVNARKAVFNAVESGKLPPPDTLTCSCKRPAEEYHHIDYVSKGGLNVVATCIECHEELHIVERLTGVKG